MTKIHINVYVYLYLYSVFVEETSKPGISVHTYALLQEEIGWWTMIKGITPNVNQQQKVPVSKAHDPFCTWMVRATFVAAHIYCIRSSHTSCNRTVILLHTISLLARGGFVVCPCWKPTTLCIIYLLLFTRVAQWFQCECTEDQFLTLSTPQTSARGSHVDTVSGHDDGLQSFSG